ncbi:MAG: type IV toxin-antitoxin system AbiEi family antitoxin domain-containing protein [Ilumatobacteraceae bacterium]
MLSIVQTIAASQRGLFTRKQARVAGIHDMWLARMKDEEVEQVQHGVWLLTGAPADRHRLARAAILLLDADGTSFVKSLRQPKCVVSHLTAAVTHGMCEQLPARNQRPMVTTAIKIATTRRVQPIVARLAPSEIVWIDGIPVTSTERTVADLSPTDFEQIRLGAARHERSDNCRVSRPTGT